MMRLFFVLPPPLVVLLLLYFGSLLVADVVSFTNAFVVVRVVPARTTSSFSSSSSSSASSLSARNYNNIIANNGGGGGDHEVHHDHQQQQQRRGCQGGGGLLRRTSSSSWGFHHCRRLGRRRSSSCGSKLYMGWGPDPIWTNGTIISNMIGSESGCYRYIQIQVTEDVAMQYKIPGQYIQLRKDNRMEKPLFLAIASSPSSSSTMSEEEDKENIGAAATAANEKEEEDSSRRPIFEFLIKKTDSNTWLCDIDNTNNVVEISQVLGNGFPMKENMEGYKYDFPTQNVLLIAAGSGIAPIKAAIESGQLKTTTTTKSTKSTTTTTGGDDDQVENDVEGSGGSIHNNRSCRLYYGERTINDLAFVDLFSTWEEQYGVQVVPVLSQPEEEEKEDDEKSTTTIVRSGYVQTALEEDGIPIPRNSAALLCGMKGMCDSVKELLLKAGVFEGRIMFNF